MEQKVRAIILQLLEHLPDSYHKDKSWVWCWDELSGDAQDLVKNIRKEANKLLGEK